MSMVNALKYKFHSITRNETELNAMIKCKEVNWFNFCLYHCKSDCGEEIIYFQNIDKILLKKVSIIIVPQKNPLLL